VGLRLSEHDYALRICRTVAVVEFASMAEYRQHHNFWNRDIAPLTKLNAVDWATDGFRAGVIVGSIGASLYSINIVFDIIRGWQHAIVLPVTEPAIDEYPYDRALVREWCFATFVEADTFTDAAGFDPHVPHGLEAPPRPDNWTFP
jgi:hypothetical protein